MPRDPRPDDRARAAAGEPPELLNTEADTVGTVKYWREDKGYGAIASEATAPWDIWCHFSAVEMTGYKALVPGERVAVHYYRKNQESFRYVADRVRPLGPGSHESEPRRPLANDR
jgi:cold shock CspA family protein